MYKVKRKKEDWRSAIFFKDYTIEVKNKEPHFVSRTMCNRKGELAHTDDMSSPDYTGMAPAVWSVPCDDIDVVYLGEQA